MLGELKNKMTEPELLEYMGLFLMGEFILAERDLERSQGSRGQEQKLFTARTGVKNIKMY